MKQSNNDVATVVGAGITLHEVLKAYEELAKENIHICVIDLYSIKPIDAGSLKNAFDKTKNIIVVEDHYGEGGIGEAVRSALNGSVVFSLCVQKMPLSGKMNELLAYEEIDCKSIIKKVKDVLKFK